MLIETEAPMPTLPPLAPEVVSAPKRCVVSPPTFVIEASAVKPWLVITEPASAVASLCMCATFTAMPAPTATPEPPVTTAEPSPFAFESEFADVFSDDRAAGDDRDPGRDRRPRRARRDVDARRRPRR